MLAGVSDVIVTDGFTGNVALKLLEGTSKILLGQVKDAITSTPFNDRSVRGAQARAQSAAQTDSTRTRTVVLRCSASTVSASSVTDRRRPRRSRTRSASPLRPGAAA